MQSHEKKLAEHSLEAPHIQNRGRFRCSNIVQTSRPLGQPLCSKFAKIPRVGYAQTFKVSTLSLDNLPQA